MTTDDEVGQDQVIDPYAWVRAALWADDVDVAFKVDGSGRLPYVANPSRERPELLVPTRSGRVAATVARRTSDARSFRERAVNLVVEVGARAGLLTVVGGRRRVDLELGTGSDDPERSVPALVAEVLGLSDLSYAVTIGKDRYNRKPVLAVFDESGGLCAFVKVGVDTVTDRNVANEATWLERIADRPGAGFRAPVVRWSGVWSGHRVLVMSVLEPGRTRRRRVIDAPPPGLVDAVAELGHGRRVRVGETATIADAHALDDERLDAARQRVLERRGDEMVVVGAWHGDLTPWNMATRSRHAPLVWDWEAAADDRAVGLDLLHSTVMVPTHLRGVTPHAALGRITADAVADHQPDAGSRAATVDLYLFEVARRDLEIMARGVPSALLPGIGAAALDRLVPDG